MNFFIRFYAYLQYRDAVKKARQAHARGNRRYYVMPNATGRVRLIVTDRQNFRRLRQKGYIGQSMKIADAQKYCFYYTGNANGGGVMSDTERAARLDRFFEWYEARRQRQRRGRRRKKAEKNEKSSRK